MINLINKISDFLDKICCTFIGCAIAAMVLVTSSQVICRAFFNALTWSEELDRYLLVWISFLAAAAVFKRKSHVVITILPDKLPEIPSRIMKLVSLTLCDILFAICFFYGIRYMQMQSAQTSPAMHLPMSIVYLAIPVGFGLMIFHSIIQYMEILKPKKGDEV